MTSSVPPWRRRTCLCFESQVRSRTAEAHRLATGRLRLRSPSVYAIGTRANAAGLGLAWLLLSLALAFLTAGNASGAHGQLSGHGLEGRTPTPIDSEPGVQAGFEQSSYL